MSKKNILKTLDNSSYVSIVIGAVLVLFFEIFAKNIKTYNSAGKNAVKIVIWNNKKRKKSLTHGAKSAILFS